MYHKLGDVVRRSDYSVKQFTLAGHMAFAASATIAGLENFPPEPTLFPLLAAEDRKDTGSRPNHHPASAVVGVGGALGLVALPE